ncbi:MAG: helix-turn-helix domain-containing protein [Clostridia bacterium]|nr:helix-turn-helix domain-containing protein [Clostridia bacterium]MDE6676898.1 helix-turn-helix domain-containing protein [Clostridia bacterium]
MNLSKFGERLSELIFDEGITPTELSKKLGSGNSNISHYIIGRFYPSLQMTLRLADYFQCTTDFLLGIESENYAKRFKPCPPFGTRLLELCKENNITRAELRRRTNIPESVMRYWVRGKTQPSIVNVVKIAEALDRSVDYILGREI